MIKFHENPTSISQSSMKIERRTRLEMYKRHRSILSRGKCARGQS